MSNNHSVLQSGTTSPTFLNSWAARENWGGGLDRSRASSSPSRSPGVRSSGVQLLKIHTNPPPDLVQQKTSTKKTADSRAFPFPSQVQARNVGQSGRRDAGPLARSGSYALAAGRDGHGAQGWGRPLFAVVGQRGGTGRQQQQQHQYYQHQRPTVTLQGPRSLPVPGQCAPGRTSHTWYIP